MPFGAGEIRMKRRTRYVFGAALAGVSLAGIPGLVSRAHAALVTNADFTFETSGVAISTSVTGSQVGPLIAEIGTGTAFGVHLGTLGTATGSSSPTATVFSSPAGNGSPHSFSSNHWVSGDYYEFDVPTTGIQNILLSFDQISSGTGPHAFSLFYSTDGSSYISFGSSAVATSGTFTSTVPATSTGSSWSTALTSTAFNVSFDLSAITGLNNAPIADFRIVDEDAAVTSTAGTDRVDNVVVSGTAVPEPTEMCLMMAAAGGALIRRRSRV